MGQCTLYDFSLNSIKFPGKSIPRDVHGMRTANFWASSALRKEGKNTPLSHSKKKLKAIAIQKLNIFTNRNDRQGDLSSAFLTELCHNQHLHHLSGREILPRNEERFSFLSSRTFAFCLKEPIMVCPKNSNVCMRCS